MNTTHQKTEEKEIVWLPKSLANKIKGMEDGKLMEAEIIKYFDESKRNMQIEIEALDDCVLQYRGLMTKAKKAFQEAKEEQLDSAYALWEKFEDDMKGLRDFVGKAKNELAPLKNELVEIKAMMSEVDRWGLKELLGIIKEINGSYYSETNNILRFLLNNYKKPHQSTTDERSVATTAQ